VLESLTINGTLVVYDNGKIRAIRGRTWTFLRYSGRTCVKCGNPLTMDRQSDYCPLCFHCHSFQGVNYIGIYHHDRDDDLRTGIYGLKGGNEFWANVFGLALSMMLVNEPPDLTREPVLVSVPSHPEDHPERDYHPPDRLARRIAIHTPCIYRPDLLVKTAPSEQKTISGSSDRFRQVRGKYEAVEGFEGTQVFLVDDVMTTGATASECARCCLDAGASEVYVLIVGRNYEFLEDRDYG
jgi:predicted amidophosphoribosyltransferase